MEIKVHEVKGGQVKGELILTQADMLLDRDTLLHRARAEFAKVMLPYMPHTQVQAVAFQEEL